MRVWVGLLWLLLGCVTGQSDDDFSPTLYSPRDDVKLAHKYPHLSISLKEQDNTFFSEEQSAKDYAISIVVFPALVSGICFISVFCLCCCLCFRCFLLGCINCFKRIFRLCKKDCCRKSKHRKDIQEKQREKFYSIYSKSFPFLLLCSIIAILWVWVGSAHLNDGVNETQDALTVFGNIAQAISNELGDMSESGSKIDSFLASNTCPAEVSSYLADIEDSFGEFTVATADAARITASIQPAINSANDEIEKRWEGAQEVAFDLSAAALFVVVIIYIIGVCMKTAILMRLALLLTIIFSFALCVVVFIEMVVVMGYSDFCMSPTHHLERTVNGMALNVLRYYTTCDGEGPLHQPVEDTKLFNSLMNNSYIDMITDFPLLSESCRDGAATMEQSFFDIAEGAANIIDFARCPYIHLIYSKLMLEGFCGSSYSGVYDIHVSHLSTLLLFFALMVNAALLYPHYKGKTLKHICFCCYSKEELVEEDPAEKEKQSFDHSDSNDDIESWLDETGVELQIKRSKDDDVADLTFEKNGNTFEYQNPAMGSYFSPSAAIAMVKVKAEEDNDETSYVLGDNDDHSMDSY